MMKKWVSVALVFTMALSLLMGCGRMDSNSDAEQSASETKEQESSGGYESDEQIVLECIQWKYEAAPAFEAWAEAFNEKYPNITVEFSGADNYKENVMGRIAANNAPALIAVPGGKYGFDLAKSGHLMDLSDSELVPRLKEELVEAQKYDGKLYTLPIDVAAHGVIYNREVFEKFELEIPQTWDEFIAVCEELKANDVVPVVVSGKDEWTLAIAGTTYASFIYGANSNFDMDVIEGNETYVNDSWRKVMEDYTTIRDNYANEDFTSLDYSLANQMIANGEAAMTIQGIWVAAAIQEYNPEVDLGFFRLPNEDTEENKCLIWGPDFTMGISATTEYKEECLLFLDFITSEEGARIWTEKVQTFSAVKGSDMEFNQIAVDINGILNTGIKTYPLVNHEWFMDNVWTDWGKTIQQYNNGKVELDYPLEFLEKAVKEAYAIYSN